ncbi:stbA family protein [Lelliottia amnigena]|uniref:plasmid segregation protein ParM domain-containing protein n=1 Tax=Lelliottia TaxID=1330545 RepID=UPI00192B4E96|nr:MULTISPECIES: plasmid segregation protein ParM domain-containing protein [Lelliottia]MBL5885674.1 stbA family protein [Lelliottia aquatilis]MBL5923252.1 stbA family protein [Lelliottia amnigena]MBL5932162.1 stbA family protein [Lelliottia amnigena]
MTELQKAKLVMAGTDIKEQVSEPLKVVIDDGSKAAKFVSLDANGDLVPQLTHNSFVEGFRVKHEGTNPFNYLIDGLGQYSYHSEATNALETTDVSHQYDEISRLNVHHALHSSGITPQDVHLYVTLPLSQFYTSLGETNNENIQRKKDNLMKPVERYLNGVRHSFNVLSVTVFPESLPAVTRAEEINGLESFEVSLVVDLGGTTLDVASITGKLEQISKVRGYDRIGCSIVYDEIRRKLESVNLNNSNAFIQHLIENRNNIAGIKVNEKLKDEVFGAVQEAIGKLQAKVLKAVSEVEEYPHYVFLVGGGSYLISSAVESHFSNSKIIMVDDPQFALSLAMADTVYAS